MEKELVKLALGLINYAIERSRTDPVLADKLQRGEPLDIGDLQLIGDTRENSGEDLDAYLNGSDS